MVGIDIIPAQPPKGVSTIQGNFLSPAVQDEVKKFLREVGWGRGRRKQSQVDVDEDLTEQGLVAADVGAYFELEKRAATKAHYEEQGAGRIAGQERNEREERVVDVVLSDMSEPWEQTDGFWKRSLSDPYYRMMNTSGMSFRDHAGSMVRYFSVPLPFPRHPPLSPQLPKPSSGMANPPEKNPLKSKRIRR